MSTENKTLTEHTKEESTERVAFKGLERCTENVRTHSRQRRKLLQRHRSMKAYM